MDPLEAYRDYLIKRKTDLEKQKRIQDYLEVLAALDALAGPTEPSMTEGQARAIRALCDDKKRKYPDDLEGWTKSRASRWLHENETGADRARRLAKRGEDPIP